MAWLPSAPASAAVKSEFLHGCPPAPQLAIFSKDSQDHSDTRGRLTMKHRGWGLLLNAPISISGIMSLKTQRDFCPKKNHQTAIVFPHQTRSEMTSGYGSPSPQYPGEHQRTCLVNGSSSPLKWSTLWSSNVTGWEMPGKNGKFPWEIIERNGKFSSKKRLITGKETILIHPHFFEQKPGPVLGGP